MAQGQHAPGSIQFAKTGVGGAGVIDPVIRLDHQSWKRLPQILTNQTIFSVGVDVVVVAAAVGATIVRS